MVHIIYIATCKTNNKSYIGYTGQPLSQRKAYHKYAAFTRKIDSKFYRAVRKYGWENFTWTILFESWDYDYCLRIVEPLLIREYDTVCSGYNTDRGGRRSDLTPEIKLKISKSVSEAYLSGKLTKNFGLANPNVNSTVRTLINESTGETFTGIRSDFIRKYKLAKSPVGKLYRGLKKSYYGWRLVEN